METIGDRIKRIREAKKFSLRGLADRADINYKTIYRLERNEGSSSVYILQKIAEALGVPLKEILGEEIIENTITPKEESKNDNVLLTSLSDVFITLEKYAKQPLTEKDKKAFKQILNIIAEKYLDD